MKTLNFQINFSINFIPSNSLRTEDGGDDDDEVKNVPRLLEVVEPQTHQLHEALAGEDADKDVVDEQENPFELFRLVIVFNRHGHHVEEDDEHDEDVKLLTHRQLEEKQL